MDTRQQTYVISKQFQHAQYSSVMSCEGNGMVEFPMELSPAGLLFTATLTPE